MNVIPEQFSKDGYAYKLVERTPFAGIWEQRLPEGSLAEFTAWEVVRIKRCKKDKIMPSGAKVSLGDEIYPATSRWGKDGWTFRDIEKAWAKFNSLPDDDSRDT